VACRCWF